MMKRIYFSILLVFLTFFPAFGVSAAELDGDMAVSDGDALNNSDSYAPAIDLSSLIDDELGGVPVVVVSDTAVAVGNNSGYQLPEYYVNYFKGVVKNLGNTEYLAFCTREYPYGNEYWVEHYRLIYDINVQDDMALQGEYPCIDIYRYSSSSNYELEQGTYSLTSVPSFAYGSFGAYSSLSDSVSLFRPILIGVLVGVLALWLIGRKTLFS